MSWYFLGGFSAYFSGPVRTAVEPLGVLGQPRVVGRGTGSRSPSRSPCRAPSRVLHEAVEVLQRPQVGMHGASWPPRLDADRPRAAGIARAGGQRVVGALAVRLADRVDRREVQDVEAERGQICGTASAVPRSPPHERGRARTRRRSAPARGRRRARAARRAARSSVRSGWRSIAAASSAAEGRASCLASSGASGSLSVRMACSITRRSAAALARSAAARAAARRPRTPRRRGLLAGLELAAELVAPRGERVRSTHSIVYCQRPGGPSTAKRPPSGRRVVGVDRRERRLDQRRAPGAFQQTSARRTSCPSREDRRRRSTRRRPRSAWTGAAATVEDDRGGRGTGCRVRAAVRLAVGSVGRAGTCRLFPMTPGGPQRETVA